MLNTPTGPSSRQARWHLLLSHFKVEVGYVPGAKNEIPDIMSRCAYPSCEVGRDVSMHGGPEDDEQMMEIIEEEKTHELQCSVVTIKWPENMMHTVKCAGVEVDVVDTFRRPKMLDLFCGTGSWDAPFRKLNWEVHTLDINPRFKPTMCCDLMNWDFEKFEPGYFDVIVASPPCQLFSHANTGRPR